MRATIQRVIRANVKIDTDIVGSIATGACVFIGICDTDTGKEVETLTEKILHLRFFPDQGGKTNLSLVDIQGQILVVSQFTLYADISKGRRPGFERAAKPDKAIPLYNLFLQKLQSSGLKIQSGEFGASMLVEIFNDGPFTINLDTDTL